MTSIEKKLKESEERFKALFKGSPVPTYAWQKVGDSFKLIDYNNAANIITQGEVQKYLGDKASEMYRERMDILEDFNSCFGQKTTIIREIKYFFASLKEEKYLLMKYAFLPPDLVLVHTEDITERNKAEEKVQYQAKLVEEVSDAIISTDLDFNIISWNKAAKSIYGWEAEDTIGKSLREIIPVEYPYDEEEDVLKKFFEDSFWKGEVIQNHKDGTPLNILASVSLINDIAGNPIGAVAINRYISEQKLVEQKLKESESKFRSIFEAIPDLYFLLSEDTTILDFRGKKQNLYIQPEEFMRKKVVDLLPHYIGEQTIKMVKKTIMTKQPQSFEYELLMQNKIHFFEARYFYLSKNRVSCFIRDITERKKIEKEISDLAKFPSENPNPVLRVDKEKILYINQSGKYLFDTTEGGMIPILLEEMINEAFDDNTIKFFEIEVNDKIYSFDIAPIQQEGYANIYGQDITERRNSEIALNIEKQFIEDILNSSLDTIFVFEPETGKTLRWNKIFSDMSGYSDEEISSMKAPDSYYSEEDLKIASEAIKRLIEEGKTTLELSLITKDGKRIPYEYKAMALKEPNGKFSIVSIGRDMTERNEAEQKLKESETRYKEAYDMANFYKDLFTHDMNNILQIINSSAEIIGFQLGDSEKSIFIENMTKMIRSQVERGSKLISDVRTLTELDEEEITTKQINISKFLNSSIDFVKNAYSDKDISIFTGNLNQKYYTNANELLQDVFDNILINGIKYNENLGIEISIRISRQIMDGKNYFKIEFIDNGVGVPDDRKNVIFQRGNRELKGSKGMGIGLSLVKKILEIFEGKIWVEDKIKGDYNKGSNFIVLLLVVD